jgi:Cgr1 family
MAPSQNGLPPHRRPKLLRQAHGLSKNQQATKAHEKEMKEEKAAERDHRVQAIKEKRAAREEKERYL